VKKALYISLIFIFIVAAMLTSCAKAPETSPMPELTPTVTPLPSIEKISDSPVTFIFSQSESHEYNSLYHQLAYIRLEALGYNVSNLYIEDSQNIQQALLDLETQGAQYVVLTSAHFSENAQRYKESSDTQMVFIQYGDYYMNDIISYQAKLYEYYYLAGVALCSESTNKVAGFVASSPDEATIRCINAFALGIKSMNKDAIVIISWIDDASDEIAISQSIESLQNQGCDVLAHFTQGGAVEKVAGDLSLHYMTASTHTQLNENEKLAIKPAINLDSYFAAVVNTAPKDLLYEFNYLGIASHVVSYELSDSVSEQTATALNSAYTHIHNGHEVFSGPIYNELGLILPEGSQLPESDILDMLWFVDNVVGELPAG